jgi:hypothetical protein
MSSGNFLSPWISFAEHSRSIFALLVSCVQVKSLFFIPAMPMKIVSGRSKSMRVGHCTRILRLRAMMDDILFYRKENVLNESDFRFRKLYNIF